MGAWATSSNCSGLRPGSWFAGAFAAPTAAQEGAWRAVAGGRNALVVAPTGSGKTLAAFLWALDRLAAEPHAGRPQAALPGALRLAAQGAGRRRRAQPARPAGRHPARRRAGSGCPRPTSPSASAPATPRPTSGGAFAAHAARHPHHHAGVAVPAAHLAGPGVAARRRDGDRRRGPRRRRHQARRPPRALARAARRAARPSRPSGSGCPRRCGRSRRWPASSAARRPVEVVAAAAAPSESTSRSSCRSPDIGRARRADAATSTRLDAAASSAPSIWPHVEERVVDLVDGAPLHDRVRQLPPAGRAADRPAQRDRRTSAPTGDEPARQPASSRARPAHGPGRRDRGRAAG